MRSGTSRPGFERAEANFATMRFAPHRHDAYAIGITLSGVQSFGYRGTTQHSEAGCAFVIHPDETHDGRAGTDEGFGYRIMYIAPRLISEALGLRALPFVRNAVTCESTLHRAVRAALDTFDGPIEDLHFDDLITRVADALAAHDPTPRKIDAKAERAIRIARAYLDDARDLPSSGTLERLTGLSRFELARQFRRCLGTSPHRYATMRRLDRARRLIAAEVSLADAAAATGFADQSHMTRQFKQAYGVAPAAWRALTRH
ncbi:MAG: AraC family transcriptional regulator [Alphaproteobacteria bacterium]